MGEKNFGTALLLWFFVGGFGAHRVYVNDKISPLFFYWLAVIFTLTIILWVDLFKLKSMVENRNEEIAMKRAFRQNNGIMK
jgi:TM2 domain-containing membrane protein YozV